MASSGVQRNSDLETSPDLVVLRREDEAILLDGRTFHPLHVRRGADLVIRTARLEGDHSDHPALVEMLLDYGILRRLPEPRHDPPNLPRIHLDLQQRMSLYLLVTHACNLACTYCFNGEETYQRTEPPTMDRSVADAAIRWALKRVSPGGELEVVFFGGEPVLRWSLVRWIIEHCEERLVPRWPEIRVRYHLTSNLTRCPSGLLELAPAVGMTFLCDVDGPPEIHDRLRPRRGGEPSHGSTAASISRLRRQGLDVSLRATITRQNVHDLAGVVAHHADLGGVSSALVPLNPVSSDQSPVDEKLLAPPDALARGLSESFDSGLFPPEQLHPFNEAISRLQARQHRRIACGAPFGCTPVVDAAGDLYPCIYFVGIPSLLIGNVLSDDDGERAFEVHSELLQRLDVDAVEPCHECNLRYLCSGGCPAMKVLTWDRPDLESMGSYARESSCAVARTVTEKLLWREAAGR